MEDDKYLEEMFKKLFSAAEKVNMEHKKSESHPIRMDLSVDSLTRYDGITEISDGQHMQEWFTKMFENCTNWDKIRDKARDHNSRLPDSIRATRMGGNLVPEPEWVEMELYERTKTMGPIKKFKADLVRKSVDNPKVKFQGRLRKCGGKLVNLKKEVRSLKAILENETMKNDIYLNDVYRQKRRELYAYKHKKQF